MLEKLTIVYRINHQDEITYINEAWLQFAARNEGLHLLLDDVLQRPQIVPTTEPARHQEH